MHSTPNHKLSKDKQERMIPNLSKSRAESEDVIGDFFDAISHHNLNNFVFSNFEPNNNEEERLLKSEFEDRKEKEERLKERFRFLKEEIKNERAKNELNVSELESQNEELRKKLQKKKELFKFVASTNEKSIIALKNRILELKNPFFGRNMKSISKVTDQIELMRIYKKNTQILSDIQKKFGVADINLARKREELQTKNKENSCGICFEEETKIVFGCGHMVCFSCSGKIDTCPYCRKEVFQRIEIFR